MSAQAADQPFREQHERLSSVPAQPNSPISRTLLSSPDSRPPCWVRAVTGQPSSLRNPQISIRKTDWSSPASDGATELSRAGVQQVETEHDHAASAIVQIADARSRVRYHCSSPKQRRAVPQTRPSKCRSYSGRQQHWPVSGPTASIDQGGHGRPGTGVR